MLESKDGTLSGLIHGQLISRHYLLTQLEHRSDWAAAQQDSRIKAIEDIYLSVRPVLEKNKPNSKGSNEEAVRDLLLNRILGILGLSWSPGVHHFGKQLDYALFDEASTFQKAQRLVNEGKEVEALKSSCAVLEAERWGKVFGDKPKKFDLSDPIFQIEFYLGNARRSDGPRWGLLSNGHTWRLYCGDSDPLRHDFLEIELPVSETLFTEHERQTFSLLVYFFSAQALRRGGRLDRLYEEAKRQSAQITAELRRQAFGAVELIASGIMKACPSSVPKLAYEAALIYLFRLLFVLKAEADGLLQQRHLSGDIADRIIRTNAESIGGGTWGGGNNFWHEMHDIFEAIAREYNGHLFEGRPPTSSPAASELDYFAAARDLLEHVTVPNQATANAIDRLIRVYHTREDKSVAPVRVDYSTLRVRELGTIYEGLLEWRLEKVSPQDAKKGSMRLLGDRRVLRVVESGDYTLVADQSDRKATGSYYTPHYVVEFIGAQVLEPLIREIEDRCNNNPADIIHETLKLRILDPAMGSGHFLVFAVEHLADYLLVQLGRVRLEQTSKTQRKPKLPLALNSPIEIVRAVIVERCIYGVDSNPLAVELAKLALWITTASRGVPLSFLNHHLRCGDSLLNVNVTEFDNELFAHKLRNQIGSAVEYSNRINSQITGTLADVSKKEEFLSLARGYMRRFRLAYDSQLAPFLGLSKGMEFHGWLEDIDRPAPQDLPKWLRDVEKAAEEFRFFHWELEFPEVWHDENGDPLDIVSPSPSLRPGFDVIIGNPPFVKAKNTTSRRAYMERWDTAEKGFHLLVPFFELSFRLLRRQGRLGFIVSNGFAKREFGQALIERFFPSVTLEEIVDCSGLSFPGHGTPTLILFGKPDSPLAGSTTMVTATLKGDLHADPEGSPLWQTIQRNHKQPGYRDDWIGVHKVPQAELAAHPWNFNFENQPTTHRIECLPHVPLRAVLEEEIGYGCITRTDDVFIQPAHVLRRCRIEVQNIRRLGVGEAFRDWTHGNLPLIIFPYGSDLRPASEDVIPRAIAFLEPHKEVLENVVMHGTVRKKETNKKWYEYSRLGREKNKTPRSIAFPEIATHNHAYFDSTGILFHQTAPVLKLPASASDPDHALLTGILNTSTALFWLKQKCFNKGAGTEEEKDRFVYAGRKLEGFPVPEEINKVLSYEFIFERENDRIVSVAKPRKKAVDKPPRTILGRFQEFAEACVECGHALRAIRMDAIFASPGEAFDSWYRSLRGFVTSESNLAGGFRDVEGLIALRHSVIDQRSRLRSRMIGLQEELDWLGYILYDLMSAEETVLMPSTPNEIEPLFVGQRPFELASIAAGPPADWSENRKKLWLRRLTLLNSNEHLKRIEDVIYKRRWVESDDYSEFLHAGTTWLLDKAEFHLISTCDHKPLEFHSWASALWKDTRIRIASCVLADIDTFEGFSRFLRGLVDDWTVPDDETQFKPKHHRLRGNLDIPNERFRYVTTQPDLYYVPDPR